MRFNILTGIILLCLTFNIYSQSTGNNFDMLSGGKYTYTYEEHYYDGVGDSFLVIDKLENGYKAVWKGINDTTTVFADNNFNTEKMILTDSKRIITAVRHGKKLKVTGVSCGDEINETLELEEDRWYQLIPFSLIHFTKSDKKKTKFSLFDPYNIKIREVEVKKKDTEITTVKGKEYSAVKMTMRLEGILKPFWKSEIWNNSENGIYLKYEGLNVVPKLYKSKMFLKNSEYNQVISDKPEKTDKKQT